MKDALETAAIWMFFVVWALLYGFVHPGRPYR